MPILNKAQVKRKVKASTSLHYCNETTEAIEESDHEVENNMSVDTLIDPEDYDAAGSTHFSNEEASHPVLASKDKKVTKSVTAKKAVKAGESKDCEPGGSPLNPGTTNISTIDNLVDPDQGYIGANDMEEVDPDMDDDVDFDFDDPDASDPAKDPNQNKGADPDAVATASEDGLENNMKPPVLEANEGGSTHEGNEQDFKMEASEDEDWDPTPSEDSEDDIEEMAEEDEESGEGGVEIEDVENEPEEAAASDEDLSILDVDETPDHEVEDVAFATAGTRLMVIKANRIIASMTGRMAVKAGRNDLYLTDQFQQVTAMQLKQHGLRKGLKSMGFALAKVNLAKQSVLKAQVAKEVHKTTAAVRRVASEKDKAFEQSLAIASVGLNRNMFKDQSNELRAHLEAEFRRFGFSGAKRILAHAFAEHGPAYAKQVIELAKKIAAMPEEVRDGYVEALDMNTGVMDEPDEDMVPVGAETDEEMEDDFGEPIEASLSRPGHVLKASAVTSGKFSVTANEILNGTRRLF